MDYARVDNGLFWLALVVGMSMLLGSAAGIYGIFKPNRCLVGLFIVMVGILTSMFIAMTVGVYFIHQKYHTAFTTIDCSDPNSIVRDLMRQYDEASTTLCYKSCPCNYQNYNATTFPSNFAYNQHGAIKMQRCREFANSDNYFIAYFMGAVEHQYACQGICKDPTPAGFPRFFYFSSVNSVGGDPSNKRCDKYLVHYVQEDIRTIKSIMLGVTITAIICFIVILILWCCCEPGSRRFRPTEEDERTLLKK